MTTNPESEAAPQAVRPEVRRKPLGASNASKAGVGKPAKRPSVLAWQITKLQAVYVSSWAKSQESCAICKSLLINPCVICEANESTDPCPYQEGECGHIYHLHCISKWIQQQPNCPICGQRWVPVQ